MGYLFVLKIRVPPSFSNNGTREQTHIISSLRLVQKCKGSIFALWQRGWLLVTSLDRRGGTTTTNTLTTEDIMHPMTLGKR